MEDKNVIKNLVASKNDLLQKRETPLLNGTIQTNGTLKKEEIHQTNVKYNGQVENNVLSNGTLNPNVTTQNTNGKVNIISNGVSTNNVMLVSSSIKRKRLLSDRGERELEYPVCDARTSTNGWSGCFFVVFFFCIYIFYII